MMRCFTFPPKSQLSVVSRLRIYHAVIFRASDFASSIPLKVRELSTQRYVRCLGHTNSVGPKDRFIASMFGQLPVKFNHPLYFITLRF